MQHMPVQLDNEVRLSRPILLDPPAASETNWTDKVSFQISTPQTGKYRNRSDLQKTNPIRILA